MPRLPALALTVLAALIIGLSTRIMFLRYVRCETMQPVRLLPTPPLIFAEGGHYAVVTMGPMIPGQTGWRVYRTTDKGSLSVKPMYGTFDTH